MIMIMYDYDYMIIYDYTIINVYEYICIYFVFMNNNNHLLFVNNHPFPKQFFVDLYDL